MPCERCTQAVWRQIPMRAVGKHGSSDHAAGIISIAPQKPTAPCSRILRALEQNMSTLPRSDPNLEPIPQLDLSAQYTAIRDEIRTAIDRVLSCQQFVLGGEGAALEEEIAALCGVAHAVGVASGTDALILALRACGVQAGDEVLLPPFTFVATGSAVSALSAKPVFADIRPDSYNL